MNSFRQAVHKSYKPFHSAHTAAVDARIGFYRYFPTCADTKSGTAVQCDKCVYRYKPYYCQLVVAGIALPNKRKMLNPINTQYSQHFSIFSIQVWFGSSMLYVDIFLHCLEHRLEDVVIEVFYTVCASFFEYKSHSH